MFSLILTLGERKKKKTIVHHTVTLSEQPGRKVYVQGSGSGFGLERQAPTEKITGHPWCTVLYWTYSQHHFVPIPTFFFF